MSLRDWLSRLAPPVARREGPIWDGLRTVLDPELGLDLVSLGMIREVDVDGPVAHVRMTLSTEGCPIGPVLVEEVRAAVAGAGYEADIQLEFEPPWSPEDIEAGARARLSRR